MIPSNCTFCGLCCTLAVKLSAADINRIKKLNYSEAEFVAYDDDNKPLLKRVNNWCVFFKREGKIGVCTIYKNRPEACKDFPGKKLCDLASNPIYKYVEDERIRQLLKNAPLPTTPETTIAAAQREAAKVFELKLKK